MLGVTPAHADSGSTSETTSGLAVVSTSLSLHLKGRTGIATLHVLLSNPTTHMVPIRFQSLLDGGGSSTASVQRKPSQHAAVTGQRLAADLAELPAQRETRVDVRVSIDDARASAGRLVVLDSAGKVVFDTASKKPLDTAFTVSRSPSGWAVAAILAAAAFLTLIVLGVALIRFKRLQIREHQPGTHRWWTNKPLAEAADWKYTDSWATSLTAVGAVLGTILSTSGFLSSAMPGVSAVTFSALNLVFVAMIAGAPLVFATWTAPEPEIPQSPPKTAQLAPAAKTVGTTLGFAAASFLTLTATLGELATIGLLVYMGAFAWPVVSSVGALLLIGVVVVLIYGRVGVSSALTHGRSYEGKGSGATRLPELSRLPPNLRGVRVALL